VNAVIGRALRIAQTRATRWAVGALTLGLALWAVARSRHEVADAMGQLEPGWLVLAVAATVGNVGLAALVWRSTLADLGSSLPLLAVGRIFFVGQLGKYLPGSVWPMVMQAELGSDHGVPRRSAAAATVVTMLVSVSSGLTVVLATLPFVPDVLPSRFRWAVLLVLPLLVALHPALLGPVIDRGLRMMGRPRLGQHTSVRGTAIAYGWAVLSWLSAGVQVWALAVPLGAPRDLHTLALCAGGYALAWAVGFIVVISPAGAGAREAALWPVLITVLANGPVLVVILISRVLFTLVDVALAGAGLAGLHTRERLRAEEPPVPLPDDRGGA
jgi:glycosyltransferase 2 family protein